MKRGILVLSLFLISSLFISGVIAGGQGSSNSQYGENDVRSEVCLVGDTNGDLVTDILDVVGLVQCILNSNCDLADDLGNSCLCSYDVNMDQTINILDVVGLVGAILNGVWGDVGSECSGVHMGCNIYGSCVLLPGEGDEGQCTIETQETDCPYDVDEYANFLNCALNIYMPLLCDYSGFLFREGTYDLNSDGFVNVLDIIISFQNPTFRTELPYIPPVIEERSCDCDATPDDEYCASSDCDWGFICLNAPGGSCIQDPHMVNITITGFEHWEIDGESGGKGLLTVHLDTGLEVAGFQMDYEMDNMLLGPGAGDIRGGLAAAAGFIMSISTSNEYLGKRAVGFAFGSEIPAGSDGTFYEVDFFRNDENEPWGDGICFEEPITLSSVTGQKLNVNWTWPEGCIEDPPCDESCGIVGNLDFDSTQEITPFCCPDGVESCMNNPVTYIDLEQNEACEGGPVGDAGLLMWLVSSLDAAGCGNSEAEITPENCPLFYWFDINSDGILDTIDVSCVNAYATGQIPDNNGWYTCVISDPSNPCYGVGTTHIGDTCCITDSGCEQ